MSVMWNEIAASVGIMWLLQCGTGFTALACRPNLKVQKNHYRSMENHREWEKGTREVEEMWGNVCSLITWRQTQIRMLHLKAGLAIKMQPMFAMSPLLEFPCQWVSLFRWFPFQCSLCSRAGRGSEQFCSDLLLGMSWEERLPERPR